MPSCSRLRPCSALCLYTCSKPHTPDTPTTVAVLGDAGATDASMLTYMHLANMGQANAIDFVLHDGDIG